MGYTRGMKTAISIPDDIFAQADALARVLKTSRSDLYTRAVREYVARHGEDEVTAALDQVCSEEAPDGAEFTRAAARRSLEHSAW